MIALEELTKLSVEEREEIIAVLEQSLADERRGDFQESPELIAEIRRRSADLKANPQSGITWSELENRIRLSRG